MTWGKIVLLFFQGALIGTGAILPGISGGVLCVAFGIYEPMMSFLSHPIRSFKRNIRILLPVLIGGAVGFVLLAKAVEAMLTASAVVTMSLFCGLICGTIPELMNKSASAGAEKGWSAFILTLILSFVLFQALEQGSEGAIQPNFGWFLFCGVVWGLSMVVPGLSSSSILLFVGLYKPMAEGIGNLNIHVILPVLLGFAATVAVTARVVDKFLKQHYAVASKIILGFVVSSVLMIAPTKFAGVQQILLSAACFAFGFFLARWMDLRQKKE